ncbi:hypothetical protein PGT21_021061 [Puccinia graminis f. sp. tritici]|uniref:Uncharacterized protein n=1 Tax=Puccinia graminis f. sp. tritici TaxID=56615 RepID=A0A5B0NUL5_PUCGR|nr:hypothetical protein PGT21_021061 [Puccinia graminis f. sp. tritici]KAA1115665.1 hypothetical protein PGTUg99_022634 [Puccinia graminis f. sp. tritici]
MQIFKAAILLVSSIGFKVALGCPSGYDAGCVAKPPFGSAYSPVSRKGREKGFGSRGMQSQQIV